VLVLAVQASELLEVAWVSLVAGITTTALFAVVVLGGARAGEARRTDWGSAATVYAGLATLAFVVFVVLVAVGVQIMLSKG
jgi:hypothetical protein